MTRQFAVLLAVKALVAASLPDAQIKGFDEETSFPQLVPTGGLVVGFPGDPGKPEIDLSPPAWNYEHPIPIEVTAPGGAAGAPIDAMIAAIGAAVTADPTLGGLCDHLSATAPIRMDRTVNEQTLAWAEFNIVAEYSTTSPLG